MTRVMLIFLMFFVISVSAQAGQLYVIVHSNHEFDSLDKQDLKRIFMASRQVFPDGVSVRLLDQKDPLVYRNFYKKALGKSKLDMRTHWSNRVFSGQGYPPEELYSDEDVIEKVKLNQGYIGYIKSGSLANDETVKVVYTVTVDD